MITCTTVLAPIIAVALLCLLLVYYFMDRIKNKNPQASSTVAPVIGAPIDTPKPSIFSKFKMGIFNTKAAESAPLHVATVDYADGKQPVKYYV